MICSAYRLPIDIRGVAASGSYIRRDGREFRLDFSGAVEFSPQMPLLWNHDHERVMGHVTHVARGADPYSLWLWARVTIACREVDEFLMGYGSGTRYGLSLGVEGSWSNGGDGLLLRVERAWEVSLTATPADVSSRVVVHNHRGKHA